jgi:PAS domain S-box-containing protein
MIASDKPEMAAPSVAALLADTLFSSACAEGAPLLVVALDPPRLVHANSAASALFGVGTFAELNEAAVEGASPGARRLRELGALLSAGAPPRLELLRFFAGRKPLVLPLSCLPVRDAAGQSYLVAAALSARAAPRPPPTNAMNAPEPSSAAVDATLSVGSPAAAGERFLWSADEHWRFADPAPALAEALGAHAPRPGETLEALRSRIGLDGDGRLEAVLAAKTTFANLRLAWPLEDGAEAAVLTLSGAPLFDRERRFLGFRGFGRLTGETIETPRTAPDILEPSKTLPTAEPGAAPTLARPASPVAAVQLEVPPTHSAEIVTLRPVPLSGLSGQNVVPIRPDLRAFLPPEENRTGQAAASIELTASERNAFREIARALGARVEDEIDPPEEPEGPAEPAQKPTSPPAELEPAQLVDRLPIGVLVARGDDALYLNRTLLDLLGYDDLAQFRALSSVSRLFGETNGENFGPTARPLTLIASDGQPVAVEGLVQAMPWRGAPATLFSFRRSPVSEIAPRLAALEKEAKERERQARELKAILDAAADGVLVLDRDSKILSLNRSGESLLGVDHREIVGADFTTLLAPEGREAARASFEALRASGLATLVDEGREMLALRRDGRAVPLFMTMARIGTTEAKFCAVMRDLTRWKAIEGDLDEARRQAEKASALKSDFLAKISHEIRTPLNAIIGFAEVIIEERFGPVGNDRYKDYVKDIHASGGHVMSLVNDLLDLSKIEAGKADLKLAPTDANLVIQECLALMQPQAANERVIMRASLAEKLPRVVADERSLRQIMLNLMSNAVKFNEPGGQVIVSTALNDSGQAIIRVRDTGIGMSEGEIATALEPFRQVGETRRAGGTGLGLPLTKALTEANRAQFTIKSGKEQGTLVELAFPTTPAAAAQ